MRRMTISMDDDLADLFDKFMEDKGYSSRSEAIRDLLRGEIGRGGVEEGTARECVGTLSYVFNHHERQLASRLAAMHHDHHDVTVSAMHAHLDHDNCLETVILRGPTKTVLEFAESVIAEKGVRHGKMNVIPVDADHGHTHGHGRGHKHTHARPRT
jgi:CopG family transcriptional regulator, nickel-responsive regulator